MTKLNERKLLDLQVLAMVEGDMIIGDETQVIKVMTTGIKVYTTARNCKPFEEETDE